MDFITPDLLKPLCKPVWWPLRVFSVSLPSLSPSPAPSAAPCSRRVWITFIELELISLGWIIVPGGGVRSVGAKLPSETWELSPQIKGGKLRGAGPSNLLPSVTNHTISRGGAWDHNSGRAGHEWSTGTIGWAIHWRGGEAAAAPLVQRRVGVAYE